MKNNIILIGMPAAGKSTVGVLLAKSLGYRFLDTDILIQEKTGRLLHEIIAADGLDRFLEIESDVLSALDTQKTVIATGGSAVYGKAAMAHLKKLGHVIYLKISFASLTERLGDYVNRGVVLRPGMTLSDLYLEREALYERYADATVDEDALAAGLTETTAAVIALTHGFLQNTTKK
ncbi:MAG: shikimate kinase [Clostridia bacterium]|nr:shikimate kinase [Clostridia bacterium]